MPFKDPDSRRAYARAWASSRREEIVEGQSCEECGATENLEFHHRDPSQKVDHRIRTWSRARRAVELAKCVVLCDPCHNEHHAAERRAPCGTNSAYRRGCRCVACRRAHAVANRRSVRVEGEAHDRT